MKLRKNTSEDLKLKQLKMSDRLLEKAAMKELMEP